jgi:hypothetical protein
MNDNLTDSQRNLLKAMRREMVEVTDPILKEIQALREQNDRMRKAENDGLRRAVIRFAKGLLALVGKEDDK